jgi:hypothetical protein
MIASQQKTYKLSTAAKAARKAEPALTFDHVTVRLFPGSIVAQ